MCRCNGCKGIAHAMRWLIPPTGQRINQISQKPEGSSFVSLRFACDRIPVPSSVQSLIRINACVHPHQRIHRDMSNLLKFPKQIEALITLENLEKNTTEKSYGCSIHMLQTHMLKQTASSLKSKERRAAHPQWALSSKLLELNSVYQMTRAETAVQMRPTSADRCSVQASQLTARPSAARMRSSHSHCRPFRHMLTGYLPAYTRNLIKCPSLLYVYDGHSERAA